MEVAIFFYTLIGTAVLTIALWYLMKIIEELLRK